MELLKQLRKLAMKTFKQFSEEGEAPTTTTNAFTQSEKDNPPVSVKAQKKHTRAAETKHSYKKKNENNDDEPLNMLNTMRKVVGHLNV
jgi:hypothetical protein